MPKFRQLEEIKIYKLHIYHRLPSIEVYNNSKSTNNQNQIPRGVFNKVSFNYGFVGRTTSFGSYPYINVEPITIVAPTKKVLKFK